MWVWWDGQSYSTDTCMLALNVLLVQFGNSNNNCIIQGQINNHSAIVMSWIMSWPSRARLNWFSSCQLRTSGRLTVKYLSSMSPVQSPSVLRYSTAWYCCLCLYASPPSYNWRSITNTSSYVAEDFYLRHHQIAMSPHSLECWLILLFCSALNSQVLVQIISYQAAKIFKFVHLWLNMTTYIWSSF